MKKIVVIAIALAAFYVFYYGPQQMQQECLEMGGEYNAEAGTCKVEVNMTISRERFEKAISEAVKKRDGS